MSDYLVEASGAHDLPEIEREIRFEEQSPAQFVKSSLSFHEGKFTNLITMHELPLSDEPKQFKLAPESQTAPEGFAKVWTGTMLAAGKNVLVCAYRKTT